MPTPFAPRQATPTTTTGAATTMPFTTTSEWRCMRCGKLLGVHRDGRMHLRFARGHEYLVSFPVQATCLGCGSLNQATDTAR